jgi:hypothetical protein
MGESIGCYTKTGVFIDRRHVPPIDQVLHQQPKK